MVISGWGLVCKKACSCIACYLTLPFLIPIYFICLLHFKVGMPSAVSSIGSWPWVVSTFGQGALSYDVLHFVHSLTQSYLDPYYLQCTGNTCNSNNRPLVGGNPWNVRRKLGGGMLGCPWALLKMFLKLQPVFLCGLAVVSQSWSSPPFLTVESRLPLSFCFIPPLQD